jgi:hypothetical protein
MGLDVVRELEAVLTSWKKGLQPVVVHPTAATPWVIGPLCIFFVFKWSMSFGLRAIYMGIGGGAHCPLD